jgi:hypothetical protein
LRRGGGGGLLAALFRPASFKRISQTRIMLNKIQSLAKKYPKTTYAVVFAVGGVAALSFGVVAKILTPAANAVASVKSKVAPSA